MLTYDQFESAVFWPADKTPIEVEIDKQLKDQHEVFWTAEAIEGLLQESAREWLELPPMVRGLLGAILMFFAVSDSFASAITLEHLLEKLAAAPMNLKSMVSFHGMMEGIHADTYGRLLKLIYQGGIDKKQIYDAICASGAVSAMIGWGEVYAAAGLGLTERLLGLVVYEGVIFTPLFAIIYAVKDKGKLKALCNANEYIARDELMHVNNALIIIKWLRSEGAISDLTEEMVHDAFRRAYGCAEQLMNEFLPHDVPDWSMIRRDFLEYTQMIANKIVVALGFTPPFTLGDFVLPRCLKAMVVPQFTSFHALKPTQYVLAKPVSDAELEALVSESQRQLMLEGE